MNGDGKRRRPPALTLKKHLEASTHADLLEFLRFWAPHEKHRNGRSALSRKLFRLMSDENTVYAKVDLLSEKVRLVLLALLRKQNYTSDLQGLFRGMEGLMMEFYEGEAALTALARRGFVRISRAQEWLHYGRSAYSIPRESALVMRGLAGADRRPLDRIFLHERYRPSDVEAAIDSAGPAPLPRSVRAAIASLPGEDLKEIAEEAITRYGGLWTRHEFVQQHEGRSLAWESARFLDSFGSAGLGTVGHVDLRERGIGIDDDVLCIYHEAVVGYVEEIRGEQLLHDLVVNARGDMQSDLRTALEMVEEAPMRVAKEGSVYKAARGRLAERLQFQLQPLMDRDEIASRVLMLARSQGLVAESPEGELVVTPRGQAWRGLPLIEQVKAAYALLLDEGGATLRSLHLSKVAPVLLAMLTAPEQKGRWWPGVTLGMIARNRYLLDLAQVEPQTPHAPLNIRHGALTELGQAAHDLAVRDLFALGIVEVALRGQDPVGVRLSALGRRALLGERGTAPGESRPLIVNPDFEVLLLPEGEVEDLLHSLDRIATRVRTGEVVQLRLDRDRVERAAASGTTAEQMLAMLADHSRAPVPQNVAYTLREWAGKVRTASLTRGILFTASDPKVIETVVHHPTLGACVAKVVDESTVFLHERALERQVAQELRALGIHLR